MCRLWCLVTGACIDHLLTHSMLGKLSADDILKFFLFFQENIINLLPAESTQRAVKVKTIKVQDCLRKQDCLLWLCMARVCPNRFCWHDAQLCKYADWGILHSETEAHCKKNPPICNQQWSRSACKEKSFGIMEHFSEFLNFTAEI